MKEEILVSVAVEEVKESEENSQENLESKSDCPKGSGLANPTQGFEAVLSTLRVIPILDLGQFHGEFVDWRNSWLVLLLMEEQHLVQKKGLGEFLLPSRAPPLDCWEPLVLSYFWSKNSEITHQNRLYYRIG